MYLKFFCSLFDWKVIVEEMFREWNFLYCIGVFDGKYVMIECLFYGGFEYFNYKGYYSIVLLVICDVNYCFIMVDVGSYGKDNDVSIFNEFNIGKGFVDGFFDIFELSEVDGYFLFYVIVGDDIFGFKLYLMKLYFG